MQRVGRGKCIREMQWAAVLVRLYKAQFIRRDIGANLGKGGYNPGGEPAHPVDFALEFLNLKRFSC